MKPAILLMVTLPLACGSNAESSEREKVVGQCITLCRINFEGTASTNCPEPLEPCLEFCASEDVFPNPCLGEAIAEIQCRIAAGAEYVCERLATGPEYSSLEGGQSECQAEHDRFTACECANYCECNDEGECVP